MDNSGHTLLVRFINSPHFTLFLCISYLVRYADTIGIHYYLCQKLRCYAYSEIEFFLPQLCQIILTVPTDSVALEEFLLETCNRSTHSAVQTFWLLQAHLEDLSHDPEARSFQICRRIYNRVQFILFNVGDPPQQKITSNPGPALVLASAVMGVTAVPSVTRFMGPITIAQGKKPRLRVFHLAHTAKLLKSRSATAASGSGSASPQNNGTSSKKTAKFDPVVTNIEATDPRIRLEVDDDDDDEEEDGLDNITATGKSIGENGFYDAENGSLSQEQQNNIEDPEDGEMPSTLYGLDGAGISSLPDLRTHAFPEFSRTSASQSSTSVYSNQPYAPNKSYLKRHVHPVPASTLTLSAKIRLLKTNYFRYETAFAYALQAISTRLRLVPKPARLSALRAEITLLNNELPGEVDIPMILETDTYRSTPRQHKMVRISPLEATILNSAERVPFLLMIEVLRDEVTFDPDTPRNQDILNNPTDYRSLFDFAYTSNPNAHLHVETAPARSRTVPNDDTDLRDTELGDISTSTFPFDDAPLEHVLPNVPSTPLPRKSSESRTPSSPRSSDLNFSSSYPSRANMPIPKNTAELNGMAVHMRTAATMLAQLDLQGSNSNVRLQRDEIEQIKTRIVSSMQHLEGQVTFDDVEVPAAQAPAAPRRSTSSVRSISSVNPEVKEAGERRLENDLKTGVIKADSSFGFGEEWEAKKERIRATSPYGHLPHWDLVSVIAKTGSDLRQEAFACQLIHAMKHVWEDADVRVWVRKMNILVTGASTGLVETITNGVSIHSLKKALAKSMLGPLETPHKAKSAATLSEYFFRVFGVRGSERFKKAQGEFIRSLAAYSLICYLLQIKDRHNGNILLDTEGHVIHIDFGFLLSNSPGSVGFEAAPFKLTQEYIDLMDGPSSEAFESFRALVKVAFKTLRRKTDDIVLLVEMMQKESPLPCFSSGDLTAHFLRQRFHLELSEVECDAFVDNQLINKSMGSIYTRLYDQYQLVTQGIYS
ncbi:kinase-like domain-containing protein [Limtongia smithiae]|uniref:kinase-like domain-containing protein n=1 Tax=Limtongia smithiae TaxID=1125753 RepID=UPI0034CD565F